MKFLGIDLGWTSGASGLCCLDWSAGHLQLLDLERLQATAEILNWVDNWAAAPEPAIIAVDAPGRERVERWGAGEVEGEGERKKGWGK